MVHMGSQRTRLMSKFCVVFVQCYAFLTRFIPNSDSNRNSEDNDLEFRPSVSKNHNHNNKNPIIYKETNEDKESSSIKRILSFGGATMTIPNFNISNQLFSRKKNLFSHLEKAA